MRLTLCGTVLAALAVGLLNSEASSEGAGDSSVTAADSAHVSGRGTDAAEVVGHGNRDNEILLLDLGQTVGTGDVVGNLQRDSEAGSVAGLVKVALIGTGAVGVDLVDGDLHDRALGDLGDALDSELVLGLLADIDVAVDLSTSASVHDVLLDLRVADDGGVLLARRDGGAVTGQGGVDEESLALASVADSLEEDSMGLDVGDESGDKRNGGS